MRWFMRGCFLYVDLRDAIRYEDGDQVIRLWKHWLVYFLGNKRKNYATEAMNLLCNLKCDFPSHVAYIVTHNRAVNMSGKEGRAKPLDQLTTICKSTIRIIVYTLYTLIISNRMIKETMCASGANSTHKHMEDISLSALFLMDVAKRVDKVFGVTQSVTHTSRDAKKDI